MSKGKYSAIKFQAWINDQQRIEQFDEEELVLGIDVAKIAFYGAIPGQHGDDVDVVYFERDQISRVVDALSELDVETVTIVVEPTGTYSDALVDQARQAGLNVIRIAGDRVANARKVFDGTDSLHDGKSAYLLARLYRCGVGERWKDHEQTTRQLRSLADLDELVERDESRYLGPLEAYLARHWPELTEIVRLQSATLLELIGEFGGPQQVSERPDEARSLMRRVGGHFLGEDKIEAIIESSRTTIGCAMGGADRQKLKYIAGMLRESQHRSAELEQQLKETARNDEETQHIAEYAGARTAVILVGLLGPLTDYASPKQLEKAEGLNLCERSSGKTAEDKQKESTGLHISKRGPGRVRKMLYWLAMRVINPTQNVYCPYATAWYQQRLQRNGGNSIKALVALMRKLTRALWWIARGEEYDGTKLFDVARLEKLGHL